MMRPTLLLTLILGLACTVGENNASAQAAVQPAGASTPQGRFSKILDGPDLTQKAVPFRFTGKGGIPVNFVLDQSSGDKSKLNAQVMVVVYSGKGPNNRSIGEIVTTWKSPVLTTAAGQSEKIKVETMIPVQSGNYVIDVIVCDTDASISQSRLADYHPEPDKFPGMMINLRQYLVTVE